MDAYKTQNIWLQFIVIAIAGFAAVAYIFRWMPIEQLRYIAVFVLLSQIYFEIRVKHTLFLTSPLFLLSSLSLIFFSVLQGFTAYLPEVPNTSFLVAVGSEAERYIAVFALITFFAHVIVAFYIKANPVIEKTTKIKINSPISKVFILSIIVVTFLHVSYYFSGLDRTAAFYTTLRHLSPPLQTFMCVFLIREGFGSTKIFKILLSLVFSLSILGMIFVGEGKIPIFIGLSLLAYWLRLNNVSIKKTILSVTMFILLGTLLLNLMMVTRSTENNPVGINLKHVNELNARLTGMPAANGVQNIFKVPISKLIWRQTDTMYCFKNLIEAHWDEPFSISKQFFWIKAIVPRILWPEKPSLSRGSSYKTKYCEMGVQSTTGIKNKKQNYGERHSSSITLLGQPIIQGGMIGLVFHMGILIVFLVGITLLTRSPRNLSTVCVTALLPWLIDFDQDFAMYVANAAKFFLTMLPLIFYAYLSINNYKFIEFTRILLRQFSKRF